MKYDLLVKNVRVVRAMGNAAARVKATYLRGELDCENGNIVGRPRGKYLHRPTGMPE